MDVNLFFRNYIFTHYLLNFDITIDSLKNLLVYKFIVCVENKLLHYCVFLPWALIFLGFVIAPEAL